jgi:hypothetical protein
MKINQGDIVKIGNEKYEVLNTTEEVDRYDVKEGRFVGEHIAVEIHKVGDSSLHATHLLKIYHKDSRMAALLKIEQDKPSTNLKKFKHRGIWLSYHDEKLIPIGEIKIEPAK